MNFFSDRIWIKFLTTVFVGLVTASTARAHVELNSPNGGEMLTAGSSFLISWEPAVAMHDTLNFDLSYSTTANSGPWTTIVAGLPAGDLAVGSIHTYSWTVPNLSDPSVWVRVRQENNIDSDYEDFSDASFAIAPGVLLGDYNDDDRVNGLDYAVWRNNLGDPNENDIHHAGDGLNGVDAADFTLWKQNYGKALNGGGAIELSIVPEPTTSSVVLAALVSLSFGRLAGRK